MILISECLFVKVIHWCTVFLLAGFIFSSSVVADEYKVIARAHQGIDFAREQWQSTIDYLNSKIPQHKFILYPVVSLDKITERVGKKEFDFILTNPSSYVEINELYGVKVIATLNNKRADTAQSRFGSVIFTHVRNEDIISINDLKNKRLIAVSEAAFGGWRVAWLEMLKQNFDPHAELKELLFTKDKTQPEVVEAVYNGIADAGVVRTDLLERLEASGKIDLRYFRVLAHKDAEGFPFFLSTDLYPEWAFAAAESVPEDLSIKVQNILFAIPPESVAAIKGNYVGWIPPSDYAPVKELLEKLNIAPFKSKSLRRNKQ